ncbi:MAG TPA: 50S ribosomal protein L5 [Candidatus Saccharibacteria bacterium]|mgnify:CR=1 FL=1|jgi:large subunit ribosomal protein L5|nr:50S ribosomal protein L5 [Candidatus Saccharibacteria bacterium]HMT55859.1 50S ribosomal protein L5 [Candidatus Saccharibacteria bacterium]
MATAKTVDTSARLKRQYTQTIRPELVKELGLKSLSEAPKITKIVVNVGLGKAKDEKKLLEIANNTLAKITGQQPIERASRMSIATFKLREGSKIGTMVTLRGDRMYEFMDRVINIILPRLRDFHGVSNKSFDGQGNYSLGFHDQSVFPELSFEETATPHGLQINFVIEAKEKEHAKALLTKFGMPFMKENK